MTTSAALPCGYAGQSTGFVHWVGKFDIKTDASITSCDYVSQDYSACVSNAATRGVTARADGGFDLAKNGVTVASMYGYRSPNGTLNVFATQNPTGANTTDTMQTSMLLTQLKSLSMPAVGNVTNYWDVQFSQNGSTRVTSLGSDSNTVTAVDGDTATRTRASDGRVDTVRYNQPTTGMHYRAAGTSAGTTFAAVNQFPIPSAGFTVSINAGASTPTQIYVVSMTRK